MKKFVIITDSCSDLFADRREKYDIEYVPMYYIYDDETHVAHLDWTEETLKELYELVRSGKRITTAQVSAASYQEAFERAIQNGCDVLYISCSSALSASVLAARKVREELLQKYPEAKIYCVDALNACSGLGMLCITASEMRAEGKGIDEVAAWIEEHKLEMHQECTADKLTYLKQAGRVSATSAFFGGLLNIKPIIISDAKGRNLAIEKVKGRRTSIARLADRVAASFNADMPYQKIRVVHAVCLEDAELLKSEIEARLPDWKGKIEIGLIGPIIGITVGPGTLAVYYYGDKVTEGADA